MQIRRAIPSDLNEIQRCAEAAYKKYIPRIGRKPAPMVADFSSAIASQCLNVFEDGSIEGFIIFFPREDHIHVENIAVLPNAQGKGIGSKLLAYAEEQAEIIGMKAIELYTNEKMSESISYYNYLGFIEIDRRKEDGFSRVYFRKNLTD